jgi:hypothetical protein
MIFEQKFQVGKYKKKTAITLSMIRINSICQFYLNYDNNRRTITSHLSTHSIRMLFR